MKRSLVAAGAISLALFLGACSAEAESSTMTPTTTTPTSSASAMSEAPMAADIVDTAVAAGDFTTLATALTAAGLVDTLKGDGPFTVFAPTDAAFAKLPAGTLDTLLKEPMGQLKDILTYHVIAGEVMAADVVTMNGQKVATVQGAELTIEVADGKVALVDVAGNRVNVVTTDVDASNGVIHVIDGVLMPTK
ncbi:MAG TPA: fasciclin domain-containing protein [Propionibacteriaceae bacterium]|nr:fasciclin domain-containing protein [Propionibacteriaceae bacterium]